MEKILYKGQELFSPKLDLVFKALFGKEDSKELLRSFLNSTLDLDIQNADDITLSNTELVSDTAEGKLSRLDVCATVKSATTKEHIDIEIQLSDRGNMLKRSVYYVSKLFSSQLEEGGLYKSLGRAIGLSILDFPMFDDDEWMHRGRLKDTKSGLEFTDCFEVNFVEIPKLSENLEDITDLKELWFYFLNAKNEKELDMLVQKSADIGTAIDKLGRISSDASLKHALIIREKAINDYYNDIAYAEEQGIEQGIQQGIEQGILETAKKALAKNIDIKTISEFTGLSEDVIKKL